MTDSSSNDNEYGAAVQLRVNSKKHAEALAKAIRDTAVRTKPVHRFSNADAVRVLESLYYMPDLRVELKEDE